MLQHHRPFLSLMKQISNRIDSHFRNSDFVTLEQVMRLRYKQMSSSLSPLGNLGKYSSIAMSMLILLLKPIHFLKRCQCSNSSKKWSPHLSLKAPRCMLHTWLVTMHRPQHLGRYQRRHASYSSELTMHRHHSRGFGFHCRGH